MHAERRYYTFVRYVIFVFLWLNRWLTSLLVLLFSHELTTLIHSTQECHLLILTSCCWCRTHLHALLLSPGNWVTFSHRSIDCTGYRSVNVSISRSHCWPIQFVVLVNLNIWIRCRWTINQLDHYGLPKNIYLLFHWQNYLPLLELSVLLHKNVGTLCHQTLETLQLCQYLVNC